MNSRPRCLPVVSLTTLWYCHLSHQKISNLRSTNPIFTTAMRPSLRSNIVSQRREWRDLWKLLCRASKIWLCGGSTPGRSDPRQRCRSRRHTSTRRRAATPGRIAEAGYGGRARGAGLSIAVLVFALAVVLVLPHSLKLRL